MQDNWQFWVVIACVLLAAGRVGLQIWRALYPAGNAGSCGSCHGCASAAGRDTVPPLVQLDLSNKH